MISLPIKDIKDVVVRRMAELIVSFVESKKILNGDWAFFEISFTEAVSEYKHRHGLKYTPRDVIQTSISGSGSVTWLFDKFDQDYVYVTATGPCTVRSFIGKYTEGQ